jgi:ubiquinone/menaquinone biosynthesis C-methylase UbiE
MSDWDAEKYHKLSDPQRGWGLRVLERLAPKDGERILDIGCGTGRLTAAIVAEATASEVIATDRSGAMLSEARRQFPDVADFVQADGLRLPFAPRTFDAVFSTATFHWIPDHSLLFSEIHRVLKAAGRLVSQCGGGPNLQSLYRRARELRSTDRYRAYFSDWSDPWNFATTEETVDRLEAAGFLEIKVDLEPAQTPFPDMQSYEAFITTVCMRHHLHRLPEDLQQPFVHELGAAAADDDPPLTLDYWRLNIDARRA